MIRLFKFSLFCFLFLGCREIIIPAEEDRAMMRVEISGGYAGISEMIIVNRDLNLTYINNRKPENPVCSKKMSEKQYLEVSLLFENVQFNKDNYYMENPISDGFLYTITYEKGTLKKSIKCDDIVYFNETSSQMKQLKSIVDKFLELKGLITN